MLETIDLDKALTKEQYVQQLIPLQVAMHALGYQVYVQKRPVILVYEGWDAGGKGGNIKRVTEKLDPRGYVVHAVSAPQGDDKTHHYLWRFWRRLPEKGQIAIFDRSWYGRVMVERIEGFCTEEEWKRAYREINRFERQLVDFGTIMLKFWIHISPEEQLRRFEARKDTPYKSWKLTDEDWRNREKWDQYEQAVNEMLRKTSTLTAPWTIVEGNCKWFARIKVLKTLVDTLSHELNYDPFQEIPALQIGKDGKSGKKAKSKKKKAAVKETMTRMPMIENFAFGVINIDGKEYDQDVIILPDGEVSTRQNSEDHKLHAKELKPIIAAKPKRLIVGQGTLKSMKLTGKALRRLRQADIKVEAYKTAKACELYRHARERERLAAVMHLRA